MSGAVSATTLAMTAVGGMAAAQLLAPKPKMPGAPPAPAAAPESQAAKVAAPDVLRKKNAAAEGGAGSSTLLTGPSGVTPDLLNLGKATLLGQ